MIPPETSRIEALAYGLKGLISKRTVAKLGVWRPLVFAALAALGYEDRQNHVRHRHHEAEIESVKDFVQAPPTNGRRVHEMPDPPMPPTNRSMIRRK